jgi:GT2 family glycosyltransferase
MNGPSTLDTAALAQRMQELADERRRLGELQTAYRLVERSKFARVRELWRDLLALTGAIGKESFVPSAGGDSFGVGDVGAVRQILELQAQNATLVDTIAAERARSGPDEKYARWREIYAPRESDFQRMREAVPKLVVRPTVSIIMATYDSNERYLRAAIDSVRAQIYPHWELCIADDASPNAGVRRVLAEYAALDARIKVALRSTNGHISLASNSALDLATGDFVAFLDHDDLLSPDALFEIADAVERNPDADMLYSDEDKIDDSGRLTDPHFKPEWSPDSFLSRMYTCHFSAYRRELVERVGRLRPEFDGSQDYDLVLRLTEQTDRIHHIPKVLYHWRVHAASTASSGSVKPYAAIAAEAALTDALRRRGEPGTATARTDCSGTYIVRYEIRDAQKVSVIVPTRDHGEDVERCLKSIFAAPHYDNFEVLILDNGSTDPASLATFERWTEQDSRVRVLRYDVPFNFSKINNYAARASTGKYLLFLNNDTEVVSPDWMAAMVEQAQRPAIGAVGALLLYPDRTIQHAGAVIGVGGVAGHSHKYFSADAPGYFNIVKAVSNYSAVTAACMMVRRDAFEEVGGFDEELAVAFNDIDFCLKLRSAGYRNVYLPHAILVHFESKSRGHENSLEKLTRFESEKQLMLARWNTAGSVDPHYSPHLTVEAENFAIRS